MKQNENAYRTYGFFDGQNMHNFKIPQKRILKYEIAATIKPFSNVQDAFLKRLENPCGTEAISRQVRPGSKVVILCDDYTRPTPSHLLLPILLDKLNELGVPDSNITILVAAGHHREMTNEEKDAKYGQAVKRVKIVHHFSCDEKNLVKIGRAGTGIDIFVNRLAVEADYRIALGIVEIHPWAGFAGGGKIVAPGIAGKKTIDQMHALPVLPSVGIGKVHDNPFWLTLTEAADMLPLNLIINCLLDIDNQLIGLATGHPREAQLQLIDKFKKVNELRFDEPADIVITSAYPKYQLWPQAAISLYNTARIVKPGGVRITLAACPEGLGDCPHEEGFYYRSFTTAHDSPEHYWQNWLGKDAVNSRNTCAAHKLLCDSQKSEGIIVSKNLPHGMINQPVLPDIEAAIDYAFSKCGREAKVAVFDKGGMVLASLKEQVKKEKL